MFNLHHKADLQEIERFSCALTEANAKLEAISRSMAMIEFTPDGFVIEANENFCAVMGYSTDEVRGKHHRIFCEEAFYRSEDYAKLWRDLARGEAHEAYDRSIDVQVSRLRRKLERDDGNEPLIRTLRNVGYLFSANVTKQ